MDTNLKKFNLCIITLFLWSVVLYAQSPDTLWTKIYGGSSNDLGHHFEETTDMGYIIVGTTSSFGTDEGALWLLKTDSIGDTVWTKIYDPPLSQAGLDVRPIDDGYIVLGFTSSLQTRYDLWLLRTDITGDTLWTRTYGGDGIDEPYTLCETTDKGYFIVAETEVPGERLIYGYLIRTDSLGDTLWTRLVDGGSKVGIVTDDDNYAVAGSKNLDAWLIKVDQGGTILWEQTYGHWNGELANDVFQTADGGYILTGYTSSFGGPPTRFDVYIVKTDSLGNMEWDNNINLNEYDYTYSVRPTTDNGYIICGFTGTVSGATRDLLIVKIDDNGDTLWTRSYGGAEWEDSYCVRQMSDGNYGVIGYTRSFGNGERDLWFLKIGYPPGISDTKSEYVQNIKIYPNPFAKSSNIYFNLTRNADTDISIYNVLGAKVRELVSGNLPAGCYTYSWDGTNNNNQILPSGVYHFLIKMNDHIATKEKIIYVSCCR